jgi:hypothetical protein
VLRHENAVLRRQLAGPVRYEPADRFWFAALSGLVRGVRTLHWDAELRRSRTLGLEGTIVRCGVTTALPDLRPTR